MIYLFEKWSIQPFMFSLERMHRDAGQPSGGAKGFTRSRTWAGRTAMERDENEKRREGDAQLVGREVFELVERLVDGSEHFCKDSRGE